MKLLVVLLMSLFMVTAVCYPAETITARSSKTFTVPSEYLVKIAYDVNSDPEYVGYAPKGSTDGATNWFIMKITYVSRNPTVVAHAVGSWTGRAALTYN